MAYSTEIINQFADLVHHLGSVDLFNSLPSKAVTAALTHGDSVLAVTWDDFGIELSDLVGGYAVFDPEFTLCYTIDAPEANTFGLDPQDVAFVRQPPSEQYFYLHFNQRDPLDPEEVLERSLLVLVAHRHRKP